jgi:ribosomal protein S18 acetylase RimI-like enzyme
MVQSALSASPLPFVIRRADFSELAMLCAVIHAAYAEFEGKLTPPSGAHKETVESLAAKLTSGKGAIAWQGEEAVGSVLFEPRGEAIYLGRLAVPPQYRGRGIGALLVRYVEKQAIVHGHSHITLGVRLQLPENTAFYTKLGYHIAGYGAHPGFTKPTYMTMVKVLRP